MEDKELIPCPYCKEDIVKGAIKCKHCGSDLTKPMQDSDEEKRTSTANIVAIVGGALLIIGLFLPWMTLGIVSANAFRKVQDAYIFLILGIVILILGIIGLTMKKNYGLIVVLCSLGSFGYMAYIYFLMVENIGTGGKLSPQIGSGFYASAVGALIAVIGGAMMAQKPKKKK